jgi:cytochrome c oxidase cbb3-type subunit 2
MASAAATVIAIAATYGYFLLFAEFALLELAKPWFGGELALRPLLAVLCAGGVAGSFLAAHRFSLDRFRNALAGGFAGCALSAIATVFAGRTGLWFAVAGVGLSLGWTTVTLSAGLRAVVGAKRLGLWCGLGTGLAYAFVNLPIAFEATPVAQTEISAGLALLGVWAARGMRPESVELPASERSNWLVWGVIFLALVWLDSAGFYILQHTPALRAQTWGGAWMLYGNAFTHLVGAVIAGLVIDLQFIAIVAGVAMALLAAADLLLSGCSENFAGARVLYTAGVSAYSVALVYFPAWRARPWLAAALFALAGWIGSALGVGMVQDLHAIPVWFVGIAVPVVFSSLVVSRIQRKKAVMLVALAIGVVGLGSREARAEDEMIARGREVYIAEGCITCHSQYLRPSVAQEILWWGPAQPLAERLTETPPLLGLRRQGPDLTNVGNRRSAEWQRLHLIAPSVISPGSRMPSYAGLFQAGDTSGDSLVAYLASLGAATLPERLANVARWTPSANALAQPANEARARKLFGQLCAACHGPEAHGDGPLASTLSLKPPDFFRDPWRRVAADSPDRLIAVTRIIKFGLVGSPMAGREYLDDSDVVALARFAEKSHR